jgi:hypothetical protein
MTHFPLILMQGNMGLRIKSLLNHPNLPEKFRTPEGWPEKMREAWADDEGAAHSDVHRAELIDGFRWMREELDKFNPDLVLIWGDDQYENFKEDCVPPFSILACEEFEDALWSHRKGKNSWNEGPETVFKFKGHKEAGKYLATDLINNGFDVAYAYKMLHHPLGHAHMNTLLFLDWDRKGLPYPVLPFAVNCIGRGLITHPSLDHMNEDDLEPPSPQPWRCHEIGAQVYRAFAASPYRVALVASASWSHAQLSPRYSFFHPSNAEDRKFYEALRDGDYDTWKNVPLEEVEASGHHEVLNWHCLVGAMAEAGRKPDDSRFVESWLCNSDKVFAVFRP